MSIRFSKVFLKNKHANMSIYLILLGQLLKTDKYAFLLIDINPIGFSWFYYNNLEELKLEIMSHITIS